MGKNDHVGQPLVIRSRTLRQWLPANFSDQKLVEMATGPISNGYHFLIYHYHTTDIYRKFEAEIWDILQLYAVEQLEYPTILEYVRSNAECGELEDMGAFHWEMVAAAVRFIARELVGG